MGSKRSRRTMLKTAGIAALGMPAASRGSASGAAAAAEAPSTIPKAGPRVEGTDTPKICLEANLGGAAPGASPEEAAAASARRIRQLGVDHVISGGPPIPWEENRLREMMDRLKNNGLTLANLMIVGFPNAIYNRPGNDPEHEKVIQSIRAAGNGSVAVVEYH